MFRHIYSVFRITFILLQNLIFIPSYLFTTQVVLYPIYLYDSKFYWKIENNLYNFLLYVVSSWSWCAGIVVHECGENWSFTNVDSELASKKGDIMSKNESSVNSIRESMSEDDREIELKLIKKDENILFISNHQSTSDVPLMFAVFSNYWERVILWVMDSQFKYTHFGVVSWTHGDFFIKPREFKAGDLIQHCMKHSYKNCYILFPEGGFRFKKQESSNRYAEKNNLVKLKYTTWPRYGAFRDLLDRKLNITRIIDCTILYKNADKPLGVFDIMKGDKKSEVYLHYQNHNVANEQLDEEWLRNIWLKKEALMRSFYDDKQQFLEQNPVYHVVNLSWLKIVLINIFFTLLATGYLLFFRCCLLDVYL